MANFFETCKPATHPKFMGDFVSGYETVMAKYSGGMSKQAILEELNSAIPPGVKFEFSSMAAYFFSKGEFAAVLDI